MSAVVEDYAQFRGLAFLTQYSVPDRELGVFCERQPNLVTSVDTAAIFMQIVEYLNVMDLQPRSQASCVGPHDPDRTQPNTVRCAIGVPGGPFTTPSSIILPYSLAPMSKSNP
uniref:uncharacterized protein LOC117611133 n=1 Tax=Osmia lignaria TaxID=473952 RepID=UPI0014797FC7|nr:uncharacterized protein LOC117611133 [Osmia lignaria]